MCKYRRNYHFNKNIALKFSAQSAISACSAASSSSSAVCFWGAGRVGSLPAGVGTWTGAAGAVVAGWRSCSSSSAPSNSSSSASNSSCHCQKLQVFSWNI